MTLCGEVDAIKRSDKLWTCLKVHWAMYIRKYHNTFTYQATVESDKGEMNDKENTNKDDDEDCLVLLPGELGVDEMEINQDELEEAEDCEREEDDDESQFVQIEESSNMEL